MKKVLSVLLAAAMVMGMSVTSFAADDDAGYKVYGSGSGTNATAVNTLTFSNYIHVVDENNNYVDTFHKDDAIECIDEGDKLYIAVLTEGNITKAAADEDWRLKSNGDADFLRDVAFVRLNTYNKEGKAVNTGANFADDLINADKSTGEKALFVRIRIKDDVTVMDDNTDLKFYILDTEDGSKSDKVKVYMDFVETGLKTLYESNLDWEVEVGTHVTKYTYHEDEKAAKATINFNDVAYGEFKMYPDESYTLAVDVDYNKALSEEYDTDVEVIDFTLGNVGNIDLVLLAEDDEYQVVAVVDGELVPVEAEYKEDYEFESGVEATGYVVEKAEYTKYALIDADVEIAVEAETEVEAPVEADKANPETGAADFVGAAVAMAVVSVAAAGALALKK